MSKELIRLTDCVMAFDEDIVLDKINLSIRDKEFLTLLGPSGCGKTTTLRIIGGFQTPTSGDVLFDGVRINAVPPHKRTINTVFQKYALFPHLNVYENIVLPIQLDGGQPDKGYTNQIIETLGLGPKLQNLPNNLSGGQQQRVAIGRALITKPKLILADEPTGNLDSKNSRDVMELLTQASRHYQQTILMITHNRNLTASVDRVFQVVDGVLTDLGGEADETLS